MTFETKSGRLCYGQRGIILKNLLEQGQLRCCRCRKISSLDYFNKYQIKKSYPYCRTCEGLSRRNSEIKQLFNVTPAQYDMMLNKQKNQCAICKQEETYKHHITKKVVHLAIDHCHKTGHLRGLLCRNCNLMLGNSRDSIKTLRAAIRYISKPREMVN